MFTVPTAHGRLQVDRGHVATTDEGLSVEERAKTKPKGIAQIFAERTRARCRAIVGPFVPPLWEPEWMPPRRTKWAVTNARPRVYTFYDGRAAVCGLVLIRRVRSSPRNPRDVCACVRVCDVCARTQW